MIFQNRAHAGEVLARELLRLKLNLKKTIVAAIPRGGVVVGDIIAKTLKIPMRALVVKKIGAPYNSELAIGATASRGMAVYDWGLISELSVPKDYLARETAKKRKEARVREQFLGGGVWGEFKGKNVVVVDDGLATGQTASAAAKIIRAFGPAKLILAVACASPGALELIGPSYDQVICPEISGDFMAVGQFYRDFRPIEDTEVKAIIEKQLTINH